MLSFNITELLMVWYVHYLGKRYHSFYSFLNSADGSEYCAIVGIRTWQDFHKKQWQEQIQDALGNFLLHLGRLFPPSAWLVGKVLLTSCFPEGWACCAIRCNFFRTPLTTCWCWKKIGNSSGWANLRHFLVTLHSVVALTTVFIAISSGLSWNWSPRIVFGTNKVGAIRHD